ncbi:hypothetical protein ACLB2K_032165 [Fragaria x ananassa]
MSTAEVACSYAAMILHDDGIPITAEKIATLLKSANVKVDSLWPSLFAKLAEKRDVIGDLILNPVCSAQAPVAMAAPAAAASAVAPAVEEKKKEEEPEEGSDDDMPIFDLFKEGGSDLNGSGDGFAAMKPDMTRTALLISGGDDGNKEVVAARVSFLAHLGFGLERAWVGSARVSLEWAFVWI